MAMPEMSAGRRASGNYVPDPNDERPRLPVPDQSRYGSATTDPLGREGRGWKKGSHGLPQLRKGWRYDPLTHETTIIPGGAADPDRSK